MINSIFEKFTSMHQQPELVKRFLIEKVQKNYSQSNGEEFMKKIDNQTWNQKNSAVSKNFVHFF